MSASSRHHPSGDGTYRLGDMLTGGTLSADLTACDNVHRVHRVFHWERLDNGVTLWQSACGERGSTSGRLGRVEHATRQMLCPRDECFSAISLAKKKPAISRPAAVDGLKLAA